MSQKERRISVIIKEYLYQALRQKAFDEQKSQRAIIEYALQRVFDEVREDK